jgi:arylsulfatase A-like enzyme
MLVKPMLLAALATVIAAGPSIIHIVADDLGWNDVALHGSSQIPTPTISRLGAEGVRFDHFYVNPVCSPTRSSMMSGRQTIHTGIYSPLSHHSDMGLNTSCNQPGSLPCKLLPRVLSDLGYETHMVSKWFPNTSLWI